jgi:glycosyltransferase involved in cell wall biosynthesis
MWGFARSRAGFGSAETEAVGIADRPSLKSDRVRTASGARVLLLVSADAAKDRQAESTRPRRDYSLLADSLNADIFDFGSVVQSRLGRVLAKSLGKGSAHALLARSRLADYDVVFSDSEHVGLLIGILLWSSRHRPRHVVLAHHLTPKKKHIFFALAKGRIDRLIVHSPAQRELVVSHLGMQYEKVEVLQYQVDTLYWKPQSAPQGAMIATAGLECRDYLTLIEAVSGLPLSVCIGASSHWSRKRNALNNVLSPPNVEVSSYTYEELRSLYARSLFVVVPLLDVDFQAGITTVLEAMAMGKALILTRTRGQCDVVTGPLWSADWESWPDGGPPISNSSGIYVPAQDIEALRSAIQFLQSNPEVAAALGQNGRVQVEIEFDVEYFASRFARTITKAAKQH